MNKCPTPTLPGGAQESRSGQSGANCPFTYSITADFAVSDGQVSGSYVEDTPSLEVTCGNVTVFPTRFRIDFEASR